MKVGDGVLFYHSNCRQSGISGIAKVVKGGYPDDTAFDPEDEHYDPKSDPKHPTWFRVDLKFIRAFPSVIPIPLLRKTPGLEKMVLFRNGRLSVQPVAKKEWAIIVDLAKRMRSLKTPKSRSRR
jgi:predicted RNA-binding protein with PUA-like domain